VARESELSEKLAHVDAEGIGYPHKGMKANPLFASLDFAHIDRVQVGFLRQFFLAHAGLGAVLADCFADDFELLLSRARHRPPSKQSDQKANTPNMGLFLSLRI
jgi:hypothetical protein